MPMTISKVTIPIWRTMICASTIGIYANGATAEQLFRCHPLYPMYCQNIHVGCAGRTTIPARAFSVFRQGDKASILFDDGSSWQAVIAEVNGETIFTRSGPREWIRIEDDGRFSHRAYRNGKAMMALGSCVD